MFIVNIMSVVIEMIGFSFFYSFMMVVEDEEKVDSVVCFVEVLVEVVKVNIWFLDLFIKEVFENVISVIMVVGGFINVVLYLLVIVCIVGVDLSIDDFEWICQWVLVICDFKFSGCYVIVDLYNVGGIFQVMKLLLDVNLLYGDC